MAKSTKRKPAQLPPGTYIVENPAWDEDAPDIDIAEQPKRANKVNKAGASSKSSSQPVSPKTGLAVLVLLGVGIVGILGAGAWWVLDNIEQKAAAAAVARAQADAAAAAEVEAQNKPPPLELEDPEVTYKASVAKTAAELGVEAPSIATLLEPNTYSNPITHGKPVVIAPGTSKTFAPLTFKVRVDNLSLERHEIRSKGEHTMLVVHNKADHPVAYRLLVRKKSNGDCLSPAVFNYDAMVIDAGATYEISVCSGRQSAEILDLRMLSITEIGARWVRQIPPAAVGNNRMAVRCHKLADEDTPRCNEDAADIARALEENLVRWEDVIDFFSRHDCQRYAWPSEYRLAKQALTSLPLLPEP